MPDIVAHTAQATASEEGATMRLRLDPSDEYMHPLTSEERFNESVYFNCYDPKQRIGAWFRLGNRPNEGYAEMTVCVYLPGGEVGFMFARPRIEGNDAFDAGGMRYEVDEPFKALRFSYQGKVARLTDPLQMRDPRKAFAEAPQADCDVALDLRGLSPMWGGELEMEEGDTPPQEMEFARGHFEQHIGARGRIALGDESWEVDAFGLRDHSWGPRSWQAPLWYRWLTCNAGPDAGFMVSIVASRNGRVRRAGMVFEDGRYTPIIDAKLEAEWVTDDYYQDRLRCIAQTPDREIEITGEVQAFIPLRNRRGEEMTRIGEGLTEYRWEGKTGYGMSEYLDQMTGGRPAGL
jgi:hypothetical protein